MTKEELERQIKKLKEDLKNAKTEKEKVGLLLKLQLKHYYLGKNKPSLKYGELAMEKAHKTGLMEEFIEASIYTAFISLKLGEVSKALEVGKRSLKLAESKGFLEGQAKGAATFSNLYNMAGYPNEGIKLANKALVYFDLMQKTFHEGKRKYKDKDIVNGIATAYHNKGTCHQGLSEIIPAMECYAKALRFYDKNVEEGSFYIETLFNIASLHYYLEDFDIAESCFKDTLKEAQKRGDIDLLGRSNYALGAIAFEHKKYESSLNYCLEGVSLLTKAKNIPALSVALGYLAKIQIIFGEKVQSEKNIKKAIELSEHSKIKECQVIVFAIYGYLKIQEEDWTTAENYFKKSVDLCIEIKNKKDLKNSYFDLFSLYENQEKYKEALFCIKKYISLLKALASERQKATLIRIPIEYKVKDLEQLLSETVESLLRLKEEKEMNRSVSLIHKFLKVNNQKIPLESILYIIKKEGSNKILIYVEGEKEAVEKRMTIKQVVEQTNAKNQHSLFQQINKSTVVNIQQIRSVKPSSKTILMENNHVFEVASSYRKMVKDKFRNH